MAGMLSRTQSFVGEVIKNEETLNILSGSEGSDACFHGGSQLEETVLEVVVTTETFWNPGLVQINSCHFLYGCLHSYKRKGAWRLPAFSSLPDPWRCTFHPYNKSLSHLMFKNVWFMAFSLLFWRFLDFYCCFNTVCLASYFCVNISSADEGSCGAYFNHAFLSCICKF